MPKQINIINMLQFSLAWPSVTEGIEGYQNKFKNKMKYDLSTKRLESHLQYSSYLTKFVSKKQTNKTTVFVLWA